MPAGNSLIDAWLSPEKSIMSAARPFRNYIHKFQITISNGLDVYVVFIFPIHI